MTIDCPAFIGALRVQPRAQAHLACHRVHSDGDSADVPVYHAASLQACAQSACCGHVYLFARPLNLMCMCAGYDGGLVLVLLQMLCVYTLLYHSM